MTARTEEAKRNKCTQKGDPAPALLGPKVRASLSRSRPTSLPRPPAPLLYPRSSATLPSPRAPGPPTPAGTEPPAPGRTWTVAPGRPAPAEK